MAIMSLAELYAQNLPFGALREVHEESERRTIASRALEVLDHEGSELKPGELVAPGSIVLLLARRGSKAFAAATESLRKNGRLDRAALTTLERGYKGRRAMPFPEAAALMRAQPTIADLTGGRFPLASNLFVPEDMELALVSMPYNGGSLAGVAFTLHEKTVPGVEGGLDAVLVRRVPRLSPAEIGALKLVPKTAFDTNIGAADACFAGTAVIVFAAVAYGVMIATSLCGRGLPDFHLDDIAIKELGPEMTARTLVRMRRQMLERRF
jgi:hypothetical protein